MRPQASEEITVTSEAAVIDQRTTTLGTSLGTQAIETLPTGRNYSSIVQVAPGVSSDANPENTDQSTITVYGSTGRRERLLHRRRQHHRRRVRLPGQGAQLRVHPGGRRQDRRLRGRVRPLDRRHHQRHHQVGRQRVPRRRLRLLRRRLAAGARPTRSSRPAARSSASPARTTALDLGGYLIKDKLWFFAAYDRVDNTDRQRRSPAGPQAGQIVESTSERDLAAAKLTWNVAPTTSR